MICYEPIKPNTGLWISSEPSPESLQIVKNFAGYKSFAVCVIQTNLNVKLSKKTGSQAGTSQTSGGRGPPRTPLNCHCLCTHQVCHKVKSICIFIPQQGLREGSTRGTSYPGPVGALLGPGRMKVRTLSFSVIKPKFTSLSQLSVQPLIYF